MLHDRCLQRTHSLLLFKECWSGPRVAVAGPIQREGQSKEADRNFSVNFNAFDQKIVICQWNVKNLKKKWSQSYHKSLLKTGNTDTTSHRMFMLAAMQRADFCQVKWNQHALCLCIWTEKETGFVEMQMPPWILFTGLISIGFASPYGQRLAMPTSALVAQTSPNSRNICSIYTVSRFSSLTLLLSCAVSGCLLLFVGICYC